MAKVIELTDEEISCIETGLHYLSMYDKEFYYSDYIGNLINKLHYSRLYVGNKI